MTHTRGTNQAVFASATQKANVDAAWHTKFAAHSRTCVAIFGGHTWAPAIKWCGAAAACTVDGAV
jgi:hypothetical protein